MKRWLLALGLAACGDARLPPYGQIVLTVTTDAPLPPPPGEALGPDDPLPLFDRMRIEVYRPGEAEPCATCTNEFDVDRERVAGGRASIGVTPPVGASGYAARVRLFRAAFATAGEPRPEATIDVTVALPVTHDEGIESVSVTLRTEDVAKRLGTREAPLAPDGAPARTDLVGTWGPAKRANCTETPRAGEVCIRGGAYWMGSPRLTAVHEPGDAPVLRLVALSPYLLGTHEVTVGELRASGLASPNNPVPFKAAEVAQNGAPLGCTYTTDRFNNEFLPVNCLSWAKAESYCEAQGGALPTEAQFQFAATAFGTSTFVWGDDPPSCEDAIYARAPLPGDPERLCPHGWVEEPGHGRRDRLAVAGGEVLDLAGNLAELALDVWSLQGEPCWRPGVLFDPTCRTPSSAPGEPDDAHVIVGGDWVNLGSRLAGAARRPAYSFATAVKGSLSDHDIVDVGFRCARPGTP